MKNFTQRHGAAAVSAHTPGPWKVGDRDGWDSGAVMPDNGIVQGSLVPVASRVSPENAALIAAAPDLLAVCMQLAARGIADAGTMEKARVAIAKATGGAA